MSYNEEHRPSSENDDFFSQLEQQFSAGSTELSEAVVADFERAQADLRQYADLRRVRGTTVNFPVPDSDTNLTVTCSSMHNAVSGCEPVDASHVILKLTAANGYDRDFVQSGKTPSEIEESWSRASAVDVAADEVIAGLRRSHDHRGMTWLQSAHNVSKVELTAETDKTTETVLNELVGDLLQDSPQSVVESEDYVLMHQAFTNGAQVSGARWNFVDAQILEEARPDVVVESMRLYDVDGTKYEYSRLADGGRRLIQSTAEQQLEGVEALMGEAGRRAVSRSSIVYESGISHPSDEDLAAFTTTLRQAIDSGPVVT
jgi:hypothetical protein